MVRSKSKSNRGLCTTIKIEKCARKNKICNNARISLGAVSPTVINIQKAGEILIGSKLEDTILNRMSKECSSSCNPIDDKRGTIEFRTHVAGVLAKRAALIAYKRAGEKI